jgi:hypothetical protein
MKFIIDVPDNQVDDVLALLSEQGIEATEAKPGKAQHRWKKALADSEFTINFAGCKGKVVWRKATEMVLKAGASLLPDSEIPTHADGSLSFVGKFAATLRKEHADAIDTKHWVTTKDVVLRSVNEVGHFMYFAGTNSWLHIKDSSGKTLDEIAKV